MHSTANRATLTAQYQFCMLHTLVLENLFRKQKPSFILKRGEYSLTIFNGQFCEIL